MHGATIKIAKALFEVSLYRPIFPCGLTSALRVCDAVISTLFVI
jgi:hypothetical protein